MRRTSIHADRAKIDQLDLQLLQLLNERTRLALEVMERKTRAGLPVYDPGREAAILQQLERNNQGPLDRPALLSIFRGVLRESKRISKRHDPLAAAAPSGSPGNGHVSALAAARASAEAAATAKSAGGNGAVPANGSAALKAPKPGEDQFRFSRNMKPCRTVVDVGGVRIGEEEIVLIAGPCSVESREQLLATAMAVKAAGASILRGGAYKPRTSPYDFQGLGLTALRLLAEVRDAVGLPVVTEVMAVEQVDLVAEYADLLQVGARNMQNYDLLKRLAKTPKPVLLKRAPAATVKEWLLAAEYLLDGGNANVVLCERGIRTFETATRNTLDLSAIALAKELSHLPVIADPSHGTGRRSLIPDMSRAAVAAGADGLMVEVHPCPDKALSDGFQSLDIEGFASLVENLSLPLRRARGVAGDSGFREGCIPIDRRGRDSSASLGSGSE